MITSARGGTVAMCVCGWDVHITLTDRLNNEIIHVMYIKL